IQVINPVGSCFMISRRALEIFNGKPWNRGYLNGVSDLDAFLNFKKHGIPVELFPSCRMVHYGSYVTKKDASWIEYDQSYGIVLYFRYWKMTPHLSTVIFGIDEIVVFTFQYLLKLLRP